MRCFPVGPRPDSRAPQAGGRVARALVLLVVTVAVTVSAADPSEAWRRVSVQTADYLPLHDVLHSAGGFLAVGDGAQYRSADGRQWQELGLEHRYVLRRLIPDVEGYLAVGGPAPVAVHLAADLKGLDPYELGGVGALRGVARHGLTRVVVGDGGLVFVATNAPAFLLNWRAVAAPEIGGLDLADVTFGAGLFVAVGAGHRIWTSPDGVAWTSRLLAGGGTFRSVAYAGGGFAALGDGGVVYGSKDGLAWTLMGGEVASGPHRLAYVADRWAIAGRDVAFIRDLADGWNGQGEWTHATAIRGYGIEGIAQDPRTGEAGAGPIVGVGAAGAVVRSADGGATWETQRLTAPAVDEGFAGVRFGSGVFVTGSQWSADGVVWHSRDRVFTDVEFSDGRFLGLGVVGSGALQSRTREVLESGDGRTTRLLGRVPGTPRSRVVYGQGRYVCMGAEPTGVHTSLPVAYSSTNGLDWVSTSLLVPGAPILGGPYVQLAFGNGRFVATTVDRPTLVSTNGVNWWAPAAGPGGWLGELAFANERFVLAPYAGSGTRTVQTSTDGETWTPADGLAAPTRYPVRLIDGQAVSFNLDLDLLTSSNQVDWVRTRLLPAGSGPLGVAWGETAAVLTGSGGVVLRWGFGLGLVAVDIPAVRRLSDGATRLWLHAVDGLPVTVEISEDLRDWIPWRTVIGGDPLTTVDDFGVPPGDARFYRSRLTSLGF